MFLKYFLEIILMVSIRARKVVPYYLSLLSSNICLALHIKTGSDTITAFIKLSSYDS